MLIGSSKAVWKELLHSLSHYFQDFEGTSLVRNLFYFDIRLLSCANCGIFLFLVFHFDISWLN